MNIIIIYFDFMMGVEIVLLIILEIKVVFFELLGFIIMEV